MVTILVLVETPLQYNILEMLGYTQGVTILVLVETPLQLDAMAATLLAGNGHNPCFSGNSFAIEIRYKTVY